LPAVLSAIVDVLLGRGMAAEELARAAADLYECLSAPVRDFVSVQGEGTALPDGLALSPTLAAECTKDAVRTAVLLRAVNAALHDALQRFPGETIDVVYAGTGPLAPLLIPLMPRFAAHPVRFTFIDVHAAAVEAVGIVAEHFGAGRIDFITADATRYEHPRPIHLLITETMQRALTREPQVAIVRQLAAQLAPGGIVVPESVRVELRGGDYAQTLLDLRAEVANIPLDDDGCLPPVRVLLPEGPVMYATAIVAYGEHTIEPNESGLTHPQLAWELPPSTELEFRYQLGASPRFLARWSISG
jgi:hypothetical protein